jgi:Rap1a immunity proteins
MKPLVFILVCLALVSPLKAEEGALKGTWLYTACTGTPDARAVCQAWIIGFYTGLSFKQAAAAPINKDLPPVCIPRDSTGGQASLIVEKFMRDHPESLNRPAWAVAYAALMQAFPCP